jgi:allophanate hydrolase
MSLERDLSIDVATLSAEYRANQTDLRRVVREVHDRLEAYGDPALFIHVLGVEDFERQIQEIECVRDRGGALPLYGIPFAVKDNIDLSGVPSTAACPDFAYVAAASATVVRRLMAAGAICVGKTNLDQFATGLVGTRSPYGTPRNPFEARYIPGGSSSGSAVAVAAGIVSFALGTDTAGSGRVPAAFNNIIGLKPTRGLLSTAGVVPACRSLDCVSIFALTCNDAATVFRICAGADPADTYSRSRDDLPYSRSINPRSFRFGVPRDDQLKFFDNPDTPKLFQAALARFTKLGGRPVTIDFAPFAQAARLLYEGPWTAERLAGIHNFLAERPGSLLTVTREIISGGAAHDAASAFRAFHELQELRRSTATTWRDIDLLLLPTAGTSFTLAEVASEPILRNTELGYYTNFVNLLDLCALAVPAGFQTNGLPFGVTLIAPAGQDEALLELGDRAHRAAAVNLGATSNRIPPQAFIPTERGNDMTVHIAVVGAHLSGLPLNHQLIERNARLVRRCRTADCYRLYVLPKTQPPKPGMVRVASGKGAAIELEVWAMSAQAFGTFVAAIPSPLGIGTVLLEDGTTAKGFVCESMGVVGAREITHFGGWRGYLESTT